MSIIPSIALFPAIRRLVSFHFKHTPSRVSCRDECSPLKPNVGMGHWVHTAPAEGEMLLATEPYKQQLTAASGAAAAFIGSALLRMGSRDATAARESRRGRTQPRNEMDEAATPVLPHSDTCELSELTRTQYLGLEPFPRGQNMPTQGQAARFGCLSSFWEPEPSWLKPHTQ